MDNLCELKFSIFCLIHRIIDRALHPEQAIDGLLRVLSQAVPQSTAAIIISSSAEVRFFFTPSVDDSGSEAEQRIRSLYKSGFDLVLRIPHPFVVLQDSPKPLFLGRKALYSIQKEQVRLVGSPVMLADEVVGAVMVDRFFGDRVPLVEDVQFLSILASFIAQILSLESQVKRREEALLRENLALRAKISEEHLGLVCMGKSEAGRKLEAEIRKIAPTEASVLIWGEPGTGKSSVAQIIRELSGRAPFPFVKVHCSLPEDLLDKELFGSGKDFLNGGIDELHSAPSAFDKAAGGTLLLDEVGDLSTAHQVKMLDILDRLQAGSFGISRPRGADVRLVAISSVNLLEAAATGSFRKDLLNRLSTLLIHVPSVRERKDDIPFLIGYFVDHACREQGRKVQLSAQVLKKLCEYDWPGNIAEIKNTVIRMVSMAAGAEIEAEGLASILEPAPATAPGAARLEAISAWSRLDEIERKEVSAALERNRWIRRRAADDLGLTFRQMNYRVKKFGLEALIREHRTRPPENARRAR
ncbi:MAG TPA: sigma 54-interacting transcriptional regulator [Deltaproteobacteria bacterium]|nr:sigma 54-interacting transcriptional regulator [Deltaproteobacteria bacterium]